MVPVADPFAPWEHDGPPPDGDGAYEVEDVLKAEKDGRAWYITVKWKGYRTATVEKRKSLLEGCGDEVRGWVMEACDRARTGRAALPLAGSDSDDTESSANEDEESSREDEIPVSAADPVFAILEARLSVSAGLV